MKDFYVYDNEQVAKDAELYIRQLGSLPITGVNAKTGEIEPNKQQTTRWANIRKRLDGKFVFPRVPQANIDATPQSAKDYFDTNYPHTIEVYDSSWFPVEEI